MSNWSPKELPDFVRVTKTGRLEDTMNKKIVYLCDGSYTRKGMQRYAGCAFFGGPLMFESWDDDSEWPTSNTAELNSILHAMEVAIFDEQLTNVEILTDSEYACKALNNYCFKWRENGWINSAGDPVANQTLIKNCLHSQIYSIFI